MTLIQTEVRDARVLGVSALFGAPWFMAIFAVLTTVGVSHKGGLFEALLAGLLFGPTAVLTLETVAVWLVSPIVKFRLMWPFGFLLYILRALFSQVPVWVASRILNPNDTPNGDPVRWSYSGGARRSPPTFDTIVIRFSTWPGSDLSHPKTRRVIRCDSQTHGHH